MHVTYYNAYTVLVYVLYGKYIFTYMYRFTFFCLNCCGGGGICVSITASPYIGSTGVLPTFHFYYHINIVVSINISTTKYLYVRIFVHVCACVSVDTSTDDLQPRSKRNIILCI